MQSESFITLLLQSLLPLLLEVILSLLGVGTGAGV